MRQWFSSERLLFRDLAEGRRDFADSKVRDDDPFWSRLWHLHLFWAVSFLKTAVTLQVKGLWHDASRRYYRSLDLLLGGSREQKFCERMRRIADKCQARIRELRDQQDSRKWRHQQLMLALDKQMKDLEQEGLAILAGKENVKDPTKYN